MEPENVAFYQQVPFIYRIKLYELFINGKKWDCPSDSELLYGGDLLMQVWL